MLRMYLVANWFNLADEACEDALYDIAAFRDFCRIDLGARDLRFSVRGTLKDDRKFAGGRHAVLRGTINVGGELDAVARGDHDVARNDKIIFNLRCCRWGDSFFAVLRKLCGRLPEEAEE